MTTIIARMTAIESDFQKELRLRFGSGGAVCRHVFRDVF